MLAAARRRVDDGDLELPLNAVARDAGVGVGTVYRHFSGRQELLEALAGESLRRLADRAGDARTVEEFLRAAMSCVLSDPAVAEVLSTPGGPCTTEGLEITRHLAAAMETLLDAGRA